MANDSIAPLRGVQPIMLDRLDAEIVKLFRPPRINRGTYSLMRQALKIIKEMGFSSTSDIVPTEAFVERFLGIWNGSHRHQSIIHLLNALAKIRDLAMDRGYQENTEHYGQMIPIPPSWDRRNPSFRQAERPIIPGSFPRGSFPEPKDFDRLVASLKGPPSCWEDARLLVFIAVICLTELRPMEALEKEIKPGDVNLDKRTIDVAGRKKPVIICEPLHEILRRWLPRAGGHYLLPIVARTEPWPSGGPQNPWARLKSACRTLGLPDYTPGSLYQFGRADADRLKGTTSPFRLEVGDGGLTVVPVSISRLRDEIMATASTMSQSTRWVMRTTFDVLGRLLSDDASTDKLTPSLISEFEAELEGFSQSKRKVTIEYFHRVCKWAIASGYRDLDPFSGRPGFYAPIARKSKPPKRPFLPKRFRLAELDASVDVPGITSPWDAWDAAVCPVHVRDDGHLVVFRRDKGPLSGSGRKLFKALEEKYPGGFTSNELRKIVGDSRGIIERWREKDADCLEAIQLAMRKGGLYRFGRSES